MAYPLPFIRHNLLFHLQDSEIANAGVSWGSSTGIIELSDAACDDLETAAEDWWALVKDRYGAGVAFFGSRFSWVGVDGKTVETKERIISPSIGIASGASYPTEVAVCVSLQTAGAGRSARGRLYWPNPTVLGGTTGGRISSTFRDDMCAAAQGYLTATVDGALFPIVASPRKPSQQPVTAVRVGDVFDSQRRRRDRIPEAYKVLPV